MSIQEPIVDIVPAAPDNAAELPPFSAVLEDAFQRWATQVAVTDAGGSISYGELDRRSAQVAAAIQQWEQAPSEPVAILTEVSRDSIIAFAGVTRSGRPLVILDQVMPVPRLRTVLQLAGATTVISDTASVELAREVAGHKGEVRLLHELETAAAGPLDRSRIRTDSLAAILFTSGSSGQPKGVMWTQRVLAAESLTSGQRMGYRTGERAAMSLPISFAAGVAVAAIALTWGATLMIKDPRAVEPAEYMEWLRRERITVIHTTPSMLRGLLATLDPETKLPDLHLWTAAGEALYDTDILTARRHLGPDAVFLQWFGSSEGGSLAMLRFEGSDPIPAGAIPVGTASPWRSFRIVDEDGNDLPVGHAGDLVVTTAVCAEGYWRDPERTAEKFIRRPDGGIDLRTGDVAMVGDDGLLRLLGRSEAAVKIRGYLVDPSEIEAALLASGRVTETVVVALTEDNITRLVAYFVPKRGSNATSVAALRGWLASQLPIWMVPTHLVSLRELPRNERGKIDRMTLPPVPPRQIEPARGPLEEQIARIWADVLHLDEVGRNDDFIELGGDSLAAETMLAAVEETIGIKLLSSDFTQATRLIDFVERVIGSVTPADRPRWPATVISMRRGDTDRAIFCIPGGGAAAFTFVPLVAQVDPKDSMVALPGRGVERRAPAEWTVGGMVRRRIAKIRKLQPQGKYLLVGHSMGAILALEMARRMAADGDDVVVFLVDPFFQGSTVNDETRPPASATPGEPARWWQRTDLHRLIRSPRLLAAGLIPARHERSLGLVFLRSMVATRWHHPLPFDGKAYAYRTEENGDPQELWSHLVPNAVVRTLPCGHLSVLQKPYVETIAADIRAEQAL